MSDTEEDLPTEEELPTEEGLPAEGHPTTEQYLAGELRVLNAHVPSRQKTVADLLLEAEPFVTCHDGTPHLFKREELLFLAGLLAPEEQQVLLLPMLIEVGGARQGETALRCMGPVEEKVASKVLDMPMTCRDGRIALYKPQLSRLRGMLWTTTQYVFLSRD